MHFEETIIPKLLAERGLCTAGATISPIGEGHSNLTWLVEDGQTRVIVRMSPHGGDAIERESRILRGLADTGIPVPRVLASGEAGAAGAPFYAMTFVEGAIITTRTPDVLAQPALRARIAASLVQTLADLHALDWRAIGVSGRPDGFNRRHLARVAAIAAGESGEPAAAFRPVHDWLAAHAPTESGASLVHNDFRIGNIVIDTHADPGAVAAVLDWELSTVGDPLLDIAYLAASLPQPGRPSTPVRELSTAFEEPGYPSRTALLDAYADASGRALDDIAWHLVFTQFKLAALYEYAHRRTLAGHGDEYYRDHGLVEQFLAAAENEIGE